MVLIPEKRAFFGRSWRRSEKNTDTCAANRYCTLSGGAGPRQKIGPAPNGAFKQLVAEAELLQAEAELLQAEAKQLAEAKPLADTEPLADAKPLAHIQN